MLDANQMVRLSFLEWHAAQRTARQQKYRMLREYYDGMHDTQLTERQRRYLEIKSGQEFNLNYCPIPVDALTERLTVTGFDAPGSELLGEWMERNRFDALQSVTHLAAVRDGDAYVLVEWDNEGGYPRMSFELADDGSAGTEIVYSDGDRRMPHCATKRWRLESGAGAGSRRRTNVYYPDRIEKLISDDDTFGGSWRKFTGDEDTWPLPWNGKAGPLGVPVFHFKNKEQGYCYGQSEIEDIVPIQNALNKTMIDLLAAADNTAFRIYWMTGGNPSTLRLAPGSWVWHEELDAKIGYFPGEDPQALINLKDSVAMEVARITRTPLSFFQISGQRAAEGTLQQEESGLVSKAKKCQITFGNTWEDAMRMGLRLYNAFGPGGVDENQPISAVWANPQTRNAGEDIATLEGKQRLGVPTQTIWRELGYTDEQIQAMLAEKAADRATQANSLAVAMLEQQREFDQGDVNE